MKIWAMTIVAVALSVLPSGCGGNDPSPPLPDSTASAAGPGLSQGVPLDPAFAQKLQAGAGSQIDLARVIVAGEAGDETIVVVARQASDQERAHGGRAAEMWIAKGDNAFRRVAEYLSYDLTCRTDDPVCPEVRGGGLGFTALRQQATGRVFAVVAATRDRPVEVTTAEGTVHRMGVVPHGTIIEVATAQPYQTRVRVSLTDGRTYSLHLPPFGVVTA
jgi:hypothetical protein